MKQLIVTCLPSFYKNIAFKKISEHGILKVFFTFDSKIKREGDFFNNGLNNEDIIEKTNVFNNLKKLYLESKKAEYVTLGGWDDLYFWFLRFIVPKRKLRLIVESSIYEFNDSALTPLKKIFVKGISECIVSGQPHYRLIRHLGFKGKITISKGVGVLDFNYEPKEKIRPEKVMNFLYVGRVSKDKGVELLFTFFEKNPELHLNIVGSVEDEKYLDIISTLQNVTYHGYKNRNELKDIFSYNDVFILASRVEPWGLVIEEALYHGLPVVVSDKVGCNEDLVKGYDTGQVFAMDDLVDLTEKIEKITNVDQYMLQCKNINSINFNEISNNYVNCFL
ncbi:glycosyltransferase family 4 protein [Solitalea lacus]|uniref:glycosyltransferase family 4 protein n=1 Tax=Solitalea lacus TaxID=2911172 RepID=UPI001EDA93A2|nr:glycosyltransferase family 4 protein [Solitalea lacus]UKJ08254.1 glycosyltransferase family 4 protein [Solitalea lacus]